MAYRILIVDDHAMIREVLCDFFKGDLDCESSLAVPDISSAIEYLRLSLVVIVLLDYDLCKELAFNFFYPLREQLLQVPVLIVSADFYLSTAIYSPSYLCASPTLLHTPHLT